MPKTTDSELDLRAAQDGPVVPQSVAEQNHIKDRRTKPGGGTVEAPDDTPKVPETVLVDASQLRAGDVIQVDDVFLHVTDVEYSESEGTATVRAADANDDVRVLQLDGGQAVQRVER